MSTSYYMRCDKCGTACDDYWQGHTQSRPGDTVAAFIRKHQETCFPGCFTVDNDAGDDPVSGPFETTDDLRRWFYEWRQSRYPGSPQSWAIKINGAAYTEDTTP